MLTKIVTKVILSRPNGDVLLIRRSATDVRRPGQWDFPGGNLEPGEQPDDAILRETQEEAGLDIVPGSLQMVNADAGTYTHPSDNVTVNLIWLLYVGKVDDAEVVLSFEHDQFIWVKPEDMLTKVTHPEHLEMLRYILENKLLAA